MEKYLTYKTMRWYGPSDPVSLSDIRQAGCEGVVTALHQVPVGEVWEAAEIQSRRKMIEQMGMTWKVVESLPVHDDIKRKAGAFRTYINNYKLSLENLARAGIEVVTYNFMPVFDWLRTDKDYRLPSGATTLFFKKIHYLLFDLFILQRPGARADYPMETIELARAAFEKMTEDGRDRLFSMIMLGLPGSDVPFTKEGVLEAIQSYEGIGREQLKENLGLFLQAVVPSAEQAGIRLAIHPDDPPFPVFGLPRIVSTEQDLADILKAAPSLYNGFCFCTGSLGARPDNDIPKMLRRFGSHIHFLHLRNTIRDMVEGDFFEADHLAGDTDMFAVMQEVVQLMQREKRRIPLRPDHGHKMLDDLRKQTYPGYSAIGRLKGLAELRGLEYGIASQIDLND
ncbi:MAG: mannonate dehydratase [Lewinellaceae bacterium]|nr:mannonate dehydratase [Lewinellaceae bacterium]